MIRIIVVLLMLAVIGSCSKSQSRNNSTPFIPQISEVKQHFIQNDFQKIANGRPLLIVKGDMDSGLTVVIGDINGDSLPDALLDYSIAPSYNDNSGGNAIKEISGIVIYLNTRVGLKKVHHQIEFSDAKPIKIENEIVFIREYVYRDDDPRCCPSQTKITKLKYSNSALVKLIE